MAIRRAIVSSLIALLVAGGMGAEGAAAPPAVQREAINVPGAPESHTPPALNRAVAVRYSLAGSPPPSVVLVLIPGLNSGPNTMDILARELIAAHGPGLEIWVVARRAALLQDRRGIEAALEYENPAFALGYYYGDLGINGQTFHLLGEHDAPYAAYWGLDVHLRDIRAIVREAHARFPDARVVLGGHSLGGIFAAVYAGYDFDRALGAIPPVRGGTAGIGASEISGLLLLDGLPVPIRFTLTADEYLNGLYVPFVGRVPGVEALTSPDPRKRVGPFAQLSEIARTKDSIAFDVISAYAFLRPDQASYFPFYPRRGLPITNAALVAGILSAEMQPDVLIRISTETPVGDFRRIPDPSGLNPNGLLDLATGRPAKGAALIDLPPPGAETPARVDFQTLLAAIMRPGADFTEWYFPWRLVIDFGLAASLDTSDPFSRQFMSMTHLRETALPILIIGAGRGLIRSPGAAAYYLSHISTPRTEVSVHIMKGYYHLDIVTATPNPAVPLILEWLNRVVH